MSKTPRVDVFLAIPIGFLILLSGSILWSIAPRLFPGYLFLIFAGLVAFIAFALIDFDILSLFSRHFYIVSIALLVITLILGRVTRGVIRWIPVGALTLQTAEIVKPFLLVFWANNLNKKAVFLMLIPIVLIFVQPSFGVAFLLTMGFLGAVLASSVKKRYFLYLALATIALIPIFWHFLAPYQRNRLISFVNPYADPLGAGYNSIQSQITVGAGKFFGRGLGRGNQTQLAFLPERQSDFIFASISEELGFVGAGLTLAALFLILWRLTVYMGRARSPEARMYLAGLFLTMAVQIAIHIGMNLGLLPITGVPLPLVSAGGSSLVGTLIGLGIAQGARKSVSPGG